MQLVPCLWKVKINSAADALYSESYPFLKQFFNAHNSRYARNKHVKVAWESVLKRSHFIKLLHKCVRVNALFKVNGDFKTGFIGFVTNIAYLSDWAGFVFFDNLVYYRFCRCCGRNFGYFDTAVRLVVIINSANLKSASAGAIDFFHRLSVINYFCAADKIGSL